MKITVQKKELKAALKAVAPAMAQNSVNESAKGILWFIKGDRIVLAACNNEIQLQAVCKASVMGNSDETVSFVTTKLVIGIVNKVDGLIAIDIPDDEDPIKGIKLTAGTASFNLPVLGKNDFMHLPNVEKDKKTHLVLKQSELVSAIRAISFAMAKNNQSMPILTGMKLEKRGDDVRLSALDGIRIATTSLTPKDDCQWGAHDATVLSGEAIKILSSLAIEPEKDVVLEFDDKLMKVKTSDFVLKAMTLVGNFINIDTALSSLKNPTGILTLDSEEIEQMRNAVEALNIVARQGKTSLCVMKFDSDNNQITIETNVNDVGSGVQLVPVKEAKGPSFSIGLNLNFLLDNLKVLDEEEACTIKFFDSAQPILIEPKEARYALCPVRITEN